MQIALTSINPVIGDFQHNLDQITTAINRAREANCELVIFPEMALSGTPPFNLLNEPSFLESHDRAFADLLATTDRIAVLCGVVSHQSFSGNRTVYNSAVLLEDRKVQFLIHKHLLDSYGGYREDDYFEKGEVCLPIPFRELRLGVTLGREIMPENDNDSAGDTYNPIAEFQQHSGADLFINLAAIPFTRTAGRRRITDLSRITRKYRTPLLHLNQMGGQDSLLFDGSCLAFNRNGGIISHTPPFANEMLIVDSARLNDSDGIEKCLVAELEDIQAALVTGIRDYVHKSGFSKVLLGLSGGIDSALACTLACRALGPENVLGVALPSAVSPPESITDARQLAENLSIPLEVLPIEESFEVMRDTLTPLLQGMNEDVTEENLQARIRADILMALANKFKLLLLATSNRSEVATGYCTLYGDTCGALAPLGDVPKTMVYELARQINGDSSHGQLIPDSILTKAPSAELRPNQKDEDELPPYEILDKIIEDQLEHGLSVAEIMDKGYNPNMVKEVIGRLNKYAFKRRQLPPNLMVTSRIFGSGKIRPLTAGYREMHD